LRIFRVSKPHKSRDFLKSLGVDGGGINIISKKMDTIFIKIEDLRTPAANILKQEALSVGAELAVPADTITCKNELVDALLIANRSQIELLSKKSLSQPFGLKEVGKRLKEYIKEDKTFPLKIMGVINANSDSFYSGSRFQKREAIDKIYQMIDEGVDIIDIGGVSSRPGSVGVSIEEELERVKPICDAIKEEKLFEKVTFSIDSYSVEVIFYALESGFSFINDITGAKNDKIIELARDYGAKLSIMHMQGTPKTMQKNPKYDSVIDEVDRFFEERIEKAQGFGLSRDNIILDVGIGFGKKLEHNLELIREHKQFLRFGCEMLIGG